MLAGRGKAPAGSGEDGHLCASATAANAISGARWGCASAAGTIRPPRAASPVSRAAPNGPSTRSARPAGGPIFPDGESRPSPLSGRVPPLPPPVRPTGACVPKRGTACRNRCASSRARTARGQALSASIPCPCRPRRTTPLSLTGYAAFRSAWPRDSYGIRHGVRCILIIGLQPQSSRASRDAVAGTHLSRRTIAPLDFPVSLSAEVRHLSP